MLELLEKLEGESFATILIWIVLIAFAIKGFIGYMDWAQNKMDIVISKRKKAEKKEESIQEQIDKNRKENQEMKENQQKMMELINKLNEKIELLIESDKDDIKSFLTKEHHYFCYQQGWIDDYNLECCERRFEHYRAENGNSYIESFMKELRALPKQPIQQNKEQQKPKE